MSAANRRYDIDWLRVIAIGLLLVYHVAIGFQSWGIMIGFITNSNSWQSLWMPMAMLNVWRIPLLFFVSGMGVYFAMQSRNWKQLLQERARRILVPFVFGIFFIVPVHMYLWQSYYHQKISYQPGVAHLWFLGNIFVYVLVLLPLFFYLERKEDGRIVAWIKRLSGSPFCLVFVIATFMIEVLLVNPHPYEMYAMTWHGFFLGLIAFFFGFCFVLGGSSFLNMLLKWRWAFFMMAAVLYAWRMLQVGWKVPDFLLVIETNCWIFALLAFAHKYLNRPGKALRYLTQAAYPVYIIHMMFLFLASLLIFPSEIDVHLKFVLVLMFTIAGCFIVYELIIRRVSFIRPLFGLPYEKAKPVRNLLNKKKEIEPKQLSV